MELKEMIIADSSGKEIDILRQDIDISVGQDNDFEISVPKEEFSFYANGKLIESKTLWNPKLYDYGNKIFIPDTEYGGIIEGWESLKNEVKVTGTSWRGLLKKVIIEPPADADHLILSGELNNCIKTLLGNHLGSLFKCSKKDTGVVVNSWAVDRYISLLDTIEKLLKEYGQKISIKYIQPKNTECGFVELAAVPIKDMSEMLEYSREESGVDLQVKDFRGGTNHLICLGKGQNAERAVLHLYVNHNGNITKEQFYKGEEERTEIYEYTSVEAEELEENGRKRLEEIKNKKEVTVKTKTENLEIGDIVAGYDNITDTSVKRAITEKILKIPKNGDPEIEYKVEGE